MAQGLFLSPTHILPVFFPYDKRGFWAVEIPNKVTKSLTYKIVLFIPGDKEYHISKKQKLITYIVGLL